MPNFGLANEFVEHLKDDLDVNDVYLDQASDFFILPQLLEIYQKMGDELKGALVSKLKAGKYAPKPPIDMEVPKKRRVTSSTGSLIGPNYFPIIPLTHPSACFNQLPLSDHKENAHRVISFTHFACALERRWI